MLREERTELFLQTLTKGIAVGGEVDAGGSVLRDLEQAILDAPYARADRVLSGAGAEIRPPRHWRQ